jgi:hypothetical protein
VTIPVFSTEIVVCTWSAFCFGLFADCPWILAESDIVRLQIRDNYPVSGLSAGTGSSRIWKSSQAMKERKLIEVMNNVKREIRLDSKVENRSRMPHKKVDHTRRNKALNVLELTKECKYIEFAEA